MLDSLNSLWLSASLILGYLLGSIPFGILFTRVAGMGDIRRIGSGNIGATNVLRTGNKALAAATLVCDMLKGTAAVVIADQWLGRDYAIAAGLAAFLGHVFPVWLKFRGGKGVATFIGVVLGLFSPAALAFGVIWTAVAAATRYSSLAALIASAATPLIVYWFGLLPEAALFALLSIMLWVTHRGNIVRLLSGTEGRIGHSGSVAAGD
jgi:glycerol-3-phosphate acyltransferase PlsY